MDLKCILTLILCYVIQSLISYSETNQLYTISKQHLCEMTKTIPKNYHIQISSLLSTLCLLPNFIIILPLDKTNPPVTTTSIQTNLATKVPIYLSYTTYTTTIFPRSTKNTYKQNKEKNQHVSAWFWTKLSFPFHKNKQPTQSSHCNQTDNKIQNPQTNNQNRHNNKKEPNLRSQFKKASHKPIDEKAQDPLLLRFQSSSDVQPMKNQLATAFTEFVRFANHNNHKNQRPNQNLYLK